MKSYSAAEAVLNKYRNQSFKYGQHDCCTLSRDLIEAYHGIKIKSPEWSGGKSEMLRIFRLYKVYSVRALLDKIAAENGWSEIDRHFIQPFDLVTLKSGRRIAAGVFNGSRVVSVSESGLCHLSPSFIIKAWRIV